MDEWYLRADDGCLLYVAEYGEEAEALVVVHGGFGSEHSYLLPAFDGAELPRRLVFYDQRGSLRSPAPLASISVDQHLADLDRLRCELGLARVSLLGHSMGGLLAMMYAARHVERVAGLVLISPVLPTVPLPRELADAQAAHDALMDDRRQRRIADELRRAGVDGSDLSDRQRTWRSRIEFGVLNLYHAERWRDARGLGAFVNVEAGKKAGSTLPTSWDLRSALSKVDGPITVILGDHDFVAPSVALELFGRLPDCEVVVVPRAGHYVWVDQSERFRSEVSRALTRA